MLAGEGFAIKKVGVLTVFYYYNLTYFASILYIQKKA